MKKSLIKYFWLVVNLFNVLPLTNLVSYFPSNLLSVFGGMFVYLDQDHSSKIIVTKENKNFISFEEAINNNKGIYKKLNKTLRGGKSLLFTYYQKNLILVKVIITALSLHILKKVLKLVQIELEEF